MSVANLSDRTPNSKPQRWLKPVVWNKKHGRALCWVEKSQKHRGWQAGRPLRMDEDLAQLKSGPGGWEPRTKGKKKGIS